MGGSIETLKIRSMDCVRRKHMQWNGEIRPATRNVLCVVRIKIKRSIERFFGNSTIRRVDEENGINVRRLEGT
jgi:hypothetical protein